MSKDEARKLLGGYATGSLTEAERTALFQAALEDQDLFDELAGEQVLKEVLDESGARQRLIAVLEPPRKHRTWLWTTAAATVAIAVVIGIVVSQRTPAPPPQQIAQVMKSPAPAEAPAAAPVPVPVPNAIKPRVIPAPAAPAPPPPAIAESSKDLQKEALQKAESENKLADQVQPAQPLAAASPAAVGALRRFEAARVATVFGFNYTVGADGFLVITPTALGFLSVTNNDSVIAPSAAVPPGTPVRIAIPPGATSLVIAFSMTPGITGAPVRRDGATGTVTDQDPPNGKILIQLFLTPATR